MSITSTSGLGPITGNPDLSTQGSYLGNNFLNGAGEMDFLSHYNSGTAFAFFGTTTTTSEATELASIASDGTINATNFNGSATNTETVNTGTVNATPGNIATVNATGAVNAGSFSTSGNVAASTVTSGSVTASGNITGNALTVNGDALFGTGGIMVVDAINERTYRVQVKNGALVLTFVQ